MTLNEHQYFDKSCKDVGRSRKIPDSYFNKKELKIGIKVEMEHTDDKEIANQIARDHLSEIPDYYTRLKKMEENGKKHWENKKTGTTSENNNHTHGYKVNKHGNGLTTTTQDDESHIHKINNYQIAASNNHIHIIQ